MPAEIPSSGRGPRRRAAAERPKAACARLTHVATITTYSGHEPTLIEAASTRTTASSRRGTFSQAELLAELVNRRIQV